MLEVKEMTQAAGRVVSERPYVRLIGAPWQDDETHGWHALADVEGALCIVALKVTPLLEEPWPTN